MPARAGCRSDPGPWRAHRARARHPWCATGRRGAARRQAVGHHLALRAAGAHAGPGDLRARRRRAAAGRPMGDLFDALTALGAQLEPLGQPDHLPVRVGHRAFAAGSVTVRGDVSSQFLSGLLLAGPCMHDGLDVHVDGALVSVPYVQMTLEVMRAFGARGELDDPRHLQVEPGGYRATDRYVSNRMPRRPRTSSPPQRSWAARSPSRGWAPAPARATWGSSTCSSAWARTSNVVPTTSGHRRRRAGRHRRRPGRPVRHRPDPGRGRAVRHVAHHDHRIGFIRGKETDRIAAVVTELGRCGIRAEQLPDGLRVHPGTPQPATVQTYDDHRMAMSFALLGLAHPGISIADPGCVAKTFPATGMPWSTCGSRSGPSVDTPTAATEGHPHVQSSPSTARRARESRPSDAAWPSAWD